MNIFKRLWAFLCFEVKELFTDIISGNLTDTEKDSLFWLCHPLGSSYGYFFYTTRINRGGI